MIYLLIRDMIYLLIIVAKRTNRIPDGLKREGKEV